MDGVNTLSEDRIFSKVTLDNVEVRFDKQYDETYCKNKNIKYIGCYIYDIKNVRYDVDIDNIKADERDNFNNNFSELENELPITEILINNFKPEFRSCSLRIDSGGLFCENNEHSDWIKITDVENLLTEVTKKVKSSFEKHKDFVDCNEEILFVPTTTSLKNDKKVILVTTVIRNKTSSDDNVKDFEFIEDIRIKSFYISEGLIIDTIAFLNKQIQKESIQSAIAAIMSRNMSHNLGSHFIAHTKNYFSQLISSIGDDDTKKNYRGVKHTLQYIQERMDFIATVVGRVTFPYGPVNVKSQLFDELTPDDFAVRHKDQESYNFLLDYLVSSERISKRSSIKENEKENYKPFLLRIGYKDENGETRIWNSQAIDSSDSEQDKNKLLNIDLAIPGGVLGRHAIFTIVENIIRNVAKHDAANIGKELCVTIIVGEDNIVIYDNIERDEKDETVKTLNEKLEELEILNVNGELNNENKGLKEMLISAIWLQNKVVSEKLWLCERNIDEINKYIEIKYVDENGNPKVAGDNEGTRHLGYVVKNICRFEKTHLIPTQDAPIPYNVIKDIKAEVICSECDYETDNGKKLSELFPHFVKISENEFHSLYDVTHKLKERFDENDNYKLFVAALGFNPDDFCVMIKPSDSDSVDAFNKQLKETGNVKYVKEIPKEDISNTILFVNHLEKNPENAIRYERDGIRPRRLDSISGGNFTHTITQPEFLMDRFNRLRVIESELVNIIIIDERAYLKYFDPSSIQNLEKLKEKYKGLATRIFNEREKIKDNSTCFDTCVNIMDDFDAFALFDSSSNKIKELVYGDDISVDTIVNNIISIQQSDSGTSWKTALQKRGIEIYNIVPDGAVEPNKKYVLKDLLDNTIISYVKKDENAGYVVHPCSCSIEEDRPKTFLSIHLGLIEKVNEVTHVSAAEIMNSLRNAFMPDYVAIHSGRGTSNDMIEGELKEYAFINFSSIQGPLDDSKYFLARQFCNFRYGKENR